MIYYIVLASGVEQSDSVIYLLFQILLQYSLLQDIEYSSLCYTVNPCRLGYFLDCFLLHAPSICGVCFTMGWVACICTLLFFNFVPNIREPHYEIWSPCHVSIHVIAWLSTYLFHNYTKTLFPNTDHFLHSGTSLLWSRTSSTGITWELLRNVSS